VVSDEEALLRACLITTAGLVDEVIVIDTGSHDDTRAVAEKLGARVISYAGPQDFAGFLSPSSSYYGSHTVSNLIGCRSVHC
jgi:glycosyltransferase involved in cell wall biosynthesis